MLANLYQDIKRQFSILAREDQPRLLDELAKIISSRKKPDSRNILELRGLGKNIWHGIDAQKYVYEERK